MRRLLISILVLVLTGCAELGYYTHAAEGQLEVLAARDPINEVLADPKTSTQTRQQLQLLNSAREFAVKRLALPDSETFRDYADLERPWVLWNVFATPPLSLEAHRWCYPLIGCQAYRSFFNEDYAKSYAQSLHDSALDVHIEPSPAYSTRGRFADPVYAPMLRFDDVTLVGMLFHELAHERVYFQSDSELNESFAMAVQYAGLQEWLQTTGKPQLYTAYRQRQREVREFSTLVLGYRDRLQALYESDKPDHFKHAAKIRLFNRLRRDYRQLKAQGGGEATFDNWFRKPLNNARLLPVVTYHGFVDAFGELFRQQRQDWSAFFMAAERLAALPVAERRIVLQTMLADHALHKYPGTISSSATAMPKRNGKPFSQTLSTVSDR
ncbi:MAG: aminopeptidase [Granulosicoccaceae bacterium]|jgi:predicted aminopeptidase